MTPQEILRIRERVARVGATIQPQLHPHAALATRNAFAHLWLGISTRFGDRWRQCAVATEVEVFVEWIGAHPNDEYEAFLGPTTRNEVRSVPDEPSLFD